MKFSTNALLIAAVSAQDGMPDLTAITNAAKDLAAAAGAITTGVGFKRTIELKDKEGKLSGSFSYWTDWGKMGDGPKEPNVFNGQCSIGTGEQFKKADWMNKEFNCYIGIKGPKIDVCKLQIKTSEDGTQQTYTTWD